MKRHLVLLISLLLLVGCASDEEEKATLTVSAAASLQDVLEAIAEDFTNDHPIIDVQFNFGASGALKEQIEQGAPVDVFISASTEKFEALDANGYVDERIDLVRNELVLIVPVEQDDIHTFEDLTSDRIEKFALGIPDAVPAGQYGMQALKYYDVWPNLESKIIYAKDVRQVLTYVETNNVQAGIVYETDARTTKKVRIVEKATASSHEPIIYPAGVVTNTSLNEEAQLFVNYLREENTQSVWEQYGFQME